MKSFFTLMGISLQSRMYYRMGLLINLLTPLILLGGQFLLWGSLYALQQSGSIGGYSREEMFSYLIAAFAIANLLTWSSENALSREIRSGDVIARCLRPASFLKQSLADMCGALALQALVNFAVAALLFALLYRYVAEPSLASLPLFIVSLLLSILVRMLLVSCFSLLCFYTTGHLGLTWTRTALTEFLSGAMIPVALFPGWLQMLAYCTPFPYMLHLPLSLLLGRELPFSVLGALGVQAAWIAFFAALHFLVYRRIRRNIPLAGG